MHGTPLGAALLALLGTLSPTQMCKTHVASSHIYYQIAHLRIYDRISETRPLTKKLPECIINATRISHTMSEVATITISLAPELLRATNCQHISERKVEQREKAKQSPHGR
jgi:hypothetical protein